MARQSAAWVLPIVVVITGILGSLIVTVVDPVMQQLFASTLWNSSTTFGTDTLGWLRDLWRTWPAFILLGLMLTVWVRTRREQ